MKTLKEGRKPETEKPPFYVGKTIECPSCGWRAKIEAGDRPDDISRNPGGSPVTFKCRTSGCKEKIFVSK